MQCTKLISERESIDPRTNSERVINGFEKMRTYSWSFSYSVYIGAVNHKMSCQKIALFTCKLSDLIKSFINTRCITPKRVTSSQDRSPRHCARATQLLAKTCCSCAEPLATLCPIWPVRDLNLRPLAPQTNVLPLDHLAGLVNFRLCSLRILKLLYV